MPIIIGESKTKKNDMQREQQKKWKMEDLYTRHGKAVIWDFEDKPMRVQSLNPKQQ